MNLDGRPRAAAAPEAVDVLIVDVHPMFVEALTSVLAVVVPQLGVAPSAVCAKRVPESLPTGRRAGCYWIFRFPMRPRATTLQGLAGWFPGAKVVILSGFDGPVVQRSALASGASAFLSKRLACPSGWIRRI